MAQVQPMWPERKRAEVCRKTEQVKGHFWLITMKTSFYLNGALVVLSLLMHLAEGSGDGDCEHFWTTLPCAALWTFCSLHLLLRRCRQHATLRDEDSLPDPLHRKVAYAASMVLVAACSSIHPAALRSAVSAANQCVFSIGSLCTVRAALLNLVVAASRIASFCLHSGPDAAEEGFVQFAFREVLVVLGAVLATYAAREMFGASVALRSEGSAPPRPEAAIALENAALSSILSASGQAEVLLDMDMHIARPAPKLAEMLGYEPDDPAASLCGMFLPLPPPISSEDTRMFLKTLDQLKYSAQVNTAVQLQFPLISMSGEAIQVLCICASLPGEGECASGYLLAMSALPPQDAEGSSSARQLSPAELEGALSLKSSAESRPLEAKEKARDAPGESKKTERPRAGHKTSTGTAAPTTVGKASEAASASTQALASNPTFDTIGPTMQGPLAREISDRSSMPSMPRQRQEPGALPSGAGAPRCRNVSISVQELRSSSAGGAGLPQAGWLGGNGQRPNVNARYSRQLDHTASMPRQYSSMSGMTPAARRTSSMSRQYSAMSMVPPRERQHTPRSPASRPRQPPRPAIQITMEQLLLAAADRLREDDDQPPDARSDPLRRDGALPRGAGC